MKSYTFPQKKVKNITNYSRIISSASYFPERSVSNKEIIEEHNLPFSEKVISRSIGVENRRVAGKDICDSDMLAEAGNLCLERIGVDKDSISRIIVTKFIGDTLFPMTASMVQRKMGCNKALQSFDMDGGTNAFLQALDLAENYISSGDEYILILSGGVINNFISNNDPRISFLFGDGASAILVGRSDFRHFIDSYFYTNWEYYNYAKGFKIEDLVFAYNDGNKKPLFDTYSLNNWKDIEEFILKASDEIVNNIVFKNNLSIDDIDLFLITENNKPLKDSIISHLSIPDNKVLSILKDHGNTMTAMLPLLYEKLRENNQLKKGLKILFLSHGEGLNGGGILYEVNEE